MGEHSNDTWTFVFLNVPGEKNQYGTPRALQNTVLQRPYKNYSSLQGGFNFPDKVCPKRAFNLFEFILKLQLLLCCGDKTRVKINQMPASRRAFHIIFILLLHPQAYVFSMHVFLAGKREGVTRFRRSVLSLRWL